jgi:RHS repeat-associated protein
LVQNDSQEITLTVEAGVEFRFWHPEQWMQIGQNAALRVEGTQANPVIFTTSDLDAPQPGQWGEVALRWDCRSSASRIDGAVIEYGGRGLHIYTGSPIIENSTFRGCSTSGILIEGDAGPLVTGCTMTANHTAVVFSGTNPDARIEKCLIKDNWGWSMTNYSSTVCLNARNNDWGYPTGPYDYIDDSSEPCGFFNPGGQGTQISQKIDYSSWIGGSQVFIDAPIRSGEILAGDSLRFRGRLVNAGYPSVHWELGDGRTSDVLEPGLIAFPVTGVKRIEFAMVDGEGAIQGYPDAVTLTVLADPGPVPDLAVTRFELPKDLIHGQTAHIAYQIANTGDGAISGDSWIDALYVSSDPYLDGTDTLLGQVVVSESLAVQEFYEGSFDVAINSDGVDALYLVLSVDDRWQVLEQRQLNNESAAALEIAVPLLSSGETVSGSFTAERRACYYRIEVPAGKNLKVFLDDVDDQGENRLYLRRGFVPTLSAYDFRSEEDGADQRILVPAALGGVWYIMAYVAVPGTGGSGDFSIRVDLSDSELISVTPEAHGNASDIVLTLKGAGFFTGAEVRLVKAGGQSYVAGQVDVDSFEQITATFAAGVAPPGEYTVQVNLPDAENLELADAFTVIDGGEAKLEVNVVAPGQVGYHALATIYVEYANTGEVAMPAPMLGLTAFQDGKQGALLTLDQSLLAIGFWTSAVPEGFGNSIQLLGSGKTPGILQPGESMRIPVYYAGWQQPWDPSYPPIEFSMSALTSESTEPLNLNEMKEAMKPAYIDDQAWETVFSNFAIGVGTTWGGFTAMLNENAAYLGRLGINIRDINELLTFQLQQADGLSIVPALASAVDTRDAGTILHPLFVRFFPNRISSRYRVGPLGMGWTHSWEISLEESSDGTVTVYNASIPRIFKPDRRGGYFPQVGDQSSLSKNDNIFSLVEPEGLAYFFADGKLDSVEDTNGNRIDLAYTNNRLTSLSNTSGGSLTIFYNAAGLIQRITDSFGNETSYFYDDANEHLILVQRYDGRTISYKYSDDPGTAVRHALTQIGYPDGSNEYFSFDSRGRLAENHGDNGGQPVAFNYGPSGKVSISNAIGAASHVFFDHQGQIVKAIDPLGNASLTSYSKDMKVIKETGSTGLGATYTYDNRGNLTSFTNPLGGVINLQYDIFNRITSMTDMKGNATALQYDGNGNLTSKTHSDSSEEIFSYDGKGRMTRLENRRKSAIDFTYNNYDHVENVYHENGAQESYGYDNQARIISATNESGATTLEYDNNFDLKKIVYPNGRSLEYTYDDAGRRASLEDQMGSKTYYHYDESGNLHRLTDKTGGTIAEYQYDILGRLARRDLGNGAYTVYQYDNADRITGLINRGPDDTIISQFSYTYDALGQRDSMTASSGVWSYEYDAAGQLTKAVFESNDSEISNQSLSYAYDAMGNRTRTVINGIVSDYTTNNMNQYTKAGDEIYGYDDDGNMTLKENGVVWNYSYDDSNRLKEATNGSDNWSFVYDAFGNRLAATKNGVKTEYLTDPVGLSSVVAEYEESGALKARYDYGLGLISRTDSTGASVFYTFDALGNTSELTDLSGNVVNRYCYLPFGRRLLAVEAVENPFQFVGEGGVAHEGGDLYFMRARFYNQALGRFIQADPLGIFGGFNLYAYAGNSPAGRTDVTGLIAEAPIEMMWELYTKGLLELGGIAPEWYVKFWSEGGGSRLISKNAMEKLLKRPFSPPRQKLPRAKRPTLKIRRISSFSPQEVRRGILSRTWGWLGRGVTYLRGVPIGSAAGIGYGAAAFAAGYAGGYILQKYIMPSSWNTYVQKALSIPIYVWVRNVSRPIDPNQKLGPGYGEAGYVRADSILPYRIEFENDPDATAPAQVVTIADQLDAKFDWSTFGLIEVGFGDHLISAPADTQAFEYCEPMTYHGKELEVHIKITFDPQSGKLDALFASIDPLTGLPPTVDIGFLPPEDGGGRGQGHLSYLILPKAGQTHGTEIRNVAIITFDFDETIATNQIDPHDPSQGTDPDKEALVTIDSTPPSSSVAALPANRPLEFNLTWSGTDAGSGVGSYAIYVSENGAPFMHWLTTSETSALFHGQEGRTYGFYSIAADHAGNTEAAKTAPEASTTIVYPDADDDGLPDETENTVACLEVDDADSDDDGLLDGEEDTNRNGAVDSGETSPCDSDTDNDGIQDGTESGVAIGHASDTDPDKFQPDMDSGSTTDPLNPDSDQDGFRDGDEDTNKNGRLDPGEDDPETACLTPPVRLQEAVPAYFESVQDCYDAATDGDTMEILGRMFFEALLFDAGMSIFVMSGYRCDYSPNPKGVSTITGRVTISGGAVVFEEACFQIGPSSQ